MHAGPSVHEWRDISIRTAHSGLCPAQLVRAACPGPSVSDLDLYVVVERSDKAVFLEKRERREEEEGSGEKRRKTRRKRATEV